MKVPKTNNSNKLPPEGSHLGVCIALIDLGTQTVTWQGDTKLLRKVRIGFELPDEKAVFKEEKGEQPFTIYKDYTLSLSDKSNLRKDLESWRGKKFSDEETGDYDLKNILGKTGLVSIVHSPSKDGSQTYANLSTITQLPKGMAREVTPVNPIKYFSLMEPDWNVFEEFPDFLKEKIRASKELQTKPFGS